MDIRKNLERIVPSNSDEENIFIHKYINHKEDPYNTDIMPITPVNPAEFIVKAIPLLEKHITISIDTPNQIEAFCRLYNYNIQLNEQKSALRLIHAAQTGTGKSFSLQIYLSMLKNESSLIVVSKVSEAIEYCKFINELREDENYAKCYYTITDKNKNSDSRVENYELSSYQCIVISHAMFKQLNQSVSIDQYKIYNNKQRDLIVIDEKINLYTKSVVSFKELIDLQDTISSLASTMGKNDFSSNILNALIKEVSFLGKVIKETKEEKVLNSEHLELLVTSYIFSDEDNKKLNNADEQQFNKIRNNYFTECNKELENIMNLFNEKINSIMEEIALLSKVTSAKFKHSISLDMKELLARIKAILTTPSSSIFVYLDNRGTYTFCIDNIINKLGSCIVLDATANVNEFYKIANYSNPDIKFTNVLRSRKYSNLSINKAKGYSQGRSSIFKSISNEERKYNAKMYLSHANGILSSSTDKLLIITHKGFKPYLIDQCDDSRIEFTHWGDHLGKNDWSDCNKVMVIGWNFISRLETTLTGINALNDINSAQSELFTSMISRLELTQIVEDLVQGVMRIQARKIDTLDGNCKPTEVYLYYQDNENYNNIIDLFVSQFPETNVSDWTPIGIKPLTKKTKPNKIVDRVIAYLEKKEATKVMDVMQKDVLEDLSINKSTASRIFNSNEYFTEQLEKKGYLLRNSNGKSKHFILK